MPRRESLQKKVARNRAPRVQIEYEVELDGAIEMKELPFVAGVLADLSGQSEKAQPDVKDRKFIDIDRDSFNEVMERMAPRVAMRVDNKLPENADDKISVDLRFKNLNDFSPENVVQQVEPLRKLFDVRTKLQGLLTKADGNDSLNKSLQEIVNNTEMLRKIGQEAGLETPEEKK